MRERGELVLYAGRVTPAEEFLKRLRRAAGRGADDRCGRGPLPQTGSAAGSGNRRAPLTHGVAQDRGARQGGRQPRCTGVPASRAAPAVPHGRICADGQRHQRVQDRLRPARQPGAGQAPAAGRIDALQAAVIAAGLAELHGKKAKRRGCGWPSEPGPPETGPAPLGSSTPAGAGPGQLAVPGVRRIRQPGRSYPAATDGRREVRPG